MQTRFSAFKLTLKHASLAVGLTAATLMCLSTYLPIVAHSLVAYTSTVDISVLGPTYTLFAHKEQTLIEGEQCYLLKLDASDDSGLTVSVEADKAERKLLGKWVFQLTGVIEISASNWTFYYRTMKTLDAVLADCDVDILIRRSDGSIRQSIATGVAHSFDVDSSWATVYASYSWLGYTVVDQSDYLEIQFYAGINYKKNNEYVNFRVDDSYLALINQTRIENVQIDFN